MDQRHYRTSSLLSLSLSLVAAVLRCDGLLHIISLKFLSLTASVTMGTCCRLSFSFFSFLSLRLLLDLVVLWWCWQMVVDGGVLRFQWVCGWLWLGLFDENGWQGWVMQPVWLRIRVLGLRLNILNLTVWIWSFVGCDRDREYVLIQIWCMTCNTREIWKEYYNWK